MTEFSPHVELIRTGQTAAMLLEANEYLVRECVSLVLSRIDDEVDANRLTPDRAVGLCHELAAFRRLLKRQKAKITVGRNLETKQ